MTAQLSNETATLFWAREWQKPQVPNLAGFLREHTQLDRADVVALCCLDLRHHWRNGLNRSVEDYVAMNEGFSSESDSLLDLIYAEYIARREAGENPQIAEFAERFPHLQNEIIRQFAVDDIIGWGIDDSRPSAAAETIIQGSSARITDRSEHPTTIGRYTILGPLDVGGQAYVYRGTHPTLQKEVVIKLSRSSAKPGEREALLAEGRVLAELEHPHLCRVYDLDFHEGRPFLVLEYLRGQNLHQAASGRKLDPLAAAELVAAVSRAADHAHKRGVIHQDIKPKNIIIDPDGQPRLIDFGLARMRSAWTDEEGVQGVISGTVEYMAPEQAQGQSQLITPKTDIFAIGGVLYFLLTGKPPFAAPSITEALRKAAAGDLDLQALDAPGIPTRLAGLCKQALALKPEDRPADAAMFAQELEDFARPKDRRWLLVGAAACLAVILFAITYFNRTPKPGPQATVPPANLVPPELALKGELKVSVWLGETYVPLPEPAPLKNGARLRVEGTVPAGMHAILVNVDSSGRSEILGRLEPQEEPTPLSYPEKRKKAGVLKGPEGTELFFLIARPGGAIDIAEITPLLDAAKPWSTLPDASVMQLTGAKVKVLLPGGNTREITQEVDQADPEGEVKDALEKLGKKLLEKFPEVHGLAVRHKE